MVPRRWFVEGTLEYLPNSMACCPHLKANREPQLHPCCALQAMHLLACKRPISIEYQQAGSTAHPSLPCSHGYCTLFEYLWHPCPTYLPPRTP